MTTKTIITPNLLNALQEVIAAALDGYDLDPKNPPSLFQQYEIAMVKHITNNVLEENLDAFKDVHKGEMFSDKPKKQMGRPKGTNSKGPG